MPPVFPLRTSIDTTDGETRAAIPAIESGLRSITLLVVTKLVLESNVADVRPTILPITPAIRAIAIAIPNPTVRVLAFFTSAVVTAGYLETHHGVSGLFWEADIVKFYEQLARRRQLEEVLNSIWNLLLSP